MINNKTSKRRIEELVEAINLHIAVNKPIPPKWLKEYNKIVKDLEDEKGSA